MHLVRVPNLGVCSGAFAVWPTFFPVAESMQASLATRLLHVSTYVRTLVQVNSLPQQLHAAQAEIRVPYDEVATIAPLLIRSGTFSGSVVFFAKPELFVKLAHFGVVVMRRFLGEQEISLCPQCGEQGVFSRHVGFIRSWASKRQ